MTNLRITEAEVRRRLYFARRQLRDRMGRKYKGWTYYIIVGYGSLDGWQANRAKGYTWEVANPKGKHCGQGCALGPRRQAVRKAKAQINYLIKLYGPCGVDAEYQREWKEGSDDYNSL